MSVVTYREFYTWRANDPETADRFMTWLTGEIYLASSTMDRGPYLHLIPDEVIVSTDGAQIECSLVEETLGPPCRIESGVFLYATKLPPVDIPDVRADDGFCTCEKPPDEEETG